MKGWIYFLSLLVFSLPVLADCLTLTDNQAFAVSTNTELCPGTYKGVTFIISQDDAVLNCANATLLGTPTLTAISITNADNTQVKNCIINGYATGYSSQFTDPLYPDYILNNRFENNSVGIRIGVSNSHITIRDNVFIHNNNGIDMGNVNSLTISGNTFTDNLREPISCSSFTAQNFMLISNNSFTGNNGLNRPTINLPCQLTNSIIADNSIYANSNIALRLTGFSKENLTITNNIITNTQRGNDTHTSMVINSVSQSIVANNTITQSGLHGIELTGYNNQILWNTIRNSTSAFGRAIYIQYDLGQNIIAHNTIAEYTYPFSIEYSGNSLFYDNHITISLNNPTNHNETNQFNTTKDCTQHNILNGPCIGGNYWSTYTGNDTDGDGFGDEPFKTYLVEDNLPLVRARTPEITLSSPLKQYVNNSATQVPLTFSCSATSADTITALNLFLSDANGTLFSLNQTSMQNSSTVKNNWELVLSEGNYVWNCKAVTTLGSFFAKQNNSLSIHPAPQEIPAEENQSEEELAAPKENPIVKEQPPEPDETPAEQPGSGKSTTSGGGGGAASRIVKKTFEAIKETAQEISTLIIEVKKCTDSTCEANPECNPCIGYCNCEIPEEFSDTSRNDTLEEQATSQKTIQTQKTYRIKPLGWALITMLLIVISYPLYFRYLRASRLAKQVTLDYSRGELHRATKDYDTVKKIYKKLYTWQKKKIIKKLPTLK